MARSSVAVQAEPLLTEELAAAWRTLSRAEKVEGLSLLPTEQAEDFFLSLSSADQGDVILGFSKEERRRWMRLLAPDDAADLVQAASAGEREALLALLDAPTRDEVRGLMAYADDHAGGLMSPRFARLRPEMTVDEAIAYLRKHKREQVETIYYSYVVDPEQHLLGAVSLRDLFAAPEHAGVRDVMRRDLLTVTAETPEREVARLFLRTGLMAIPVVDTDRHVSGIVTLDDVIHVVQEVSTEEFQRFGGTEALSAPYLTVGFMEMIRKRGGWLSALFLGEMLTATAMGYFQQEIERAVVLALFVPLIISSGGNSGSQASTLVIRAMALDEVRLGDWWRVLRRELSSGVVLGSILAIIGMARILSWVGLFGAYGDHYLLVAWTVALSLVGVVTFGTLAGSLLPFLLRRLGFDPASACAPFVATLVDVTGLVIYFSVASVIMRGTLL